MVKALDLIGDNSQLQGHWVRRIVAAIIDGFIMFVIWIVIGAIIAIASVFIPGGLLILPLFSGLLWVLYSAVLEGMGGATIGKRVLNLQVVSIEGPMDFIKAGIRNISKIYWLLLLIDWLVGFVTEGDPRQRFMDRIAGTSVVRTDAQEIFVGAYQPPAGPMPAPYQAEPQAPQYPGQEPYPGAAQPAPQPYPATPKPEYGAPQPKDIEPAPIATREEKMEPVAEEAEKEFTREELVNLRKDELIKIARERNLEISGTKRDLIDRILGEEVED